MAGTNRYSRILQAAAALALVVGVAAFGWIAGQHLPLAAPASRVRDSMEPLGQTAHAEESLDQQIAAVDRGAGSTIHVASRPIAGSDVARLCRLKNLQVLLLDHEANAIGDEECAALAGLDSLLHLRIRGGTIGDAGAACLAKLPQLKILNLPQSRVTDDGLAILAKMPRLAQLRLGSPQITDAGMRTLSRFPALRQLHLIGAPITDVGLAEIGRLPHLESLYLDDSRITGAGLDRLFRSRSGLHVHVNQRHHDRDPQRGHE